MRTSGKQIKTFDKRQASSPKAIVPVVQWGAHPASLSPSLVLQAWSSHEGIHWVPLPLSWQSGQKHTNYEPRVKRVYKVFFSVMVQSFIALFFFVSNNLLAYTWHLTDRFKNFMKTGVRCCKYSLGMKVGFLFLCTFFSIPNNLLAYTWHLTDRFKNFMRTGARSCKYSLGIKVGTLFFTAST